MSARVSDIWRAWINEALPRLAPNDRAKWELTMAVAPPPPNGPGLVFLLLVTMPGVVLGSTMQELTQVSNPAGATKEQVVELLSKMVGSLHTERSRQIAEAGQARPNGVNPRPPGLIIPGG